MVQFSSAPTSTLGPASPVHYYSALYTRRLVFQLAEVAVPREVFLQVLERIGGLHAAPG